METLAVQFLDQGFHRVLFNAMPMPVFVMDPDVGILEYNTAAARFLQGEKQAILQRRGGEVLCCLHATETPEGCGHSEACSDCVVRQAVESAVRGCSVTRQWTEMDLLVKGKRRIVNLRVTSQPVTFERHSMVLLILEGLNDGGETSNVMRDQGGQEWSV